MGILDYGLPRNRGCDHNWTEWEERKSIWHPHQLGFDNGKPYISHIYIRERECEKCDEQQREKSREERMHLEIARTEEITYNE